MQDPPTLLPQMMQILQTGEYDSVATRRVSRDVEPPIRSFFARMFYKVINIISDADIVDGARDFRLMKKEMVAAIVSMNEYNRFSKGIFGWIGFKTYWLPYENVERVAGETKWNFYYGSSVSIPCFYCNQKIIVWRSCCWLGSNYMYHCFLGRNSAVFNRHDWKICSENICRK